MQLFKPQMARARQGAGAGTVVCAVFVLACIALKLALRPFGGGALPSSAPSSNEFKATPPSNGYTSAPPASPAGADQKHFLATKSKEAGVVTLPSGLAYRVLVKGASRSHPTADSPCSCHYKGSLTGNAVRPQLFAPQLFALNCLPLN